MAPAPGLALVLTVLGIMLMGFNRTRLVGWTISDLSFLAAAGFMVTDMLAGRQAKLAPPRARRFSPPILLGSIILLTAGSLSALRAWHPDQSVLIVLRFAWITLGWTWLMRSVCADRLALFRLLRGWRWLVIVNSLVAVAGQLGLVQWGVPNSENRQTGFFGQPNELAGLVVIGLPLLLLGVPPSSKVRTEGRELLSRAWPAALVFYAVATTGSMSGLLAGAAGGLTILVMGGTKYVLRPGRGRTNPLVPTFAVLVALIGFAVLATSDLPVVERFTRLSEGDAYVESSVGSRGRSNEQVLARFDESLVVGQGFADFGSFSFDASDVGIGEAAGAHNMFARFIFFAGLPGLIGILVILGFTANHGLLLVRNLRGTELHATAIALFAAFVAANSFAMFQPTEYQRYYWLTVAMLGALWSLRREELRQETEARIASVLHPEDEHA